MDGDLSKLIALADDDHDTCIEIVRIEWDRAGTRLTVSVDVTDEIENVRWR